MEDLISIIVPVYNVENYLDKCIESIVNQTYQILEILLIDDGSTDNSGKKCDEWAKKDKRIKVIHKENSGASSTRNVGLEICQGKYIGFVDSDDYIEKNMYEIMYKEISKDKSDLVICEYDYKITEDSKSINNTKIDKYISERITPIQALEEVYPLSGGVYRGLFLKEKLKKCKFDVNRYIAEDLIFICNYLLECDNNIIFVKAILYHYIKRENSITNQKKSKSKRLQYQIDFLDAIQYTKSMIIKYYENMNEISIIEKKTVGVYWMIVYAILNEKLIDNNKLIKKYYDELKQYKRYFSLKDKVYMFTLRIDPIFFKTTYKNMKRIKKLLNKEVN